MAGPKIVIMGWYGNGNMGDEMILQCMLEDLRRVLPAASFTVVSDDPADTSSRHGVRSMMRGGTRTQRIRRSLAIMGADLFILGGGNLLKRHGASDSSVLAWLAPLHFAHRIGVRTMTYAIGVSREWSPSGEKLVNKILREADAVCVRDRASDENLRALGFDRGIITADPVVLLAGSRPGSAAIQSLRGRPRVSVFLRHWYVYENRTLDELGWNRFQQSLANSLDSLIVGHSARVRFVPMRTMPGDDDRIVAREVVHMMRNGADTELIDEPAAAIDVARITAESDLVIGMRLHALIVAASLGKAAIAINYEEKVRSFEESIGAPDWVVGMYQGENEIVGLAEKGIAGSYPQKTVEERVADLRIQAHSNAEIASRLVQKAGAPARSLTRAFRAGGFLLERILGGQSP
jgi:polysaccharide pyruvyl transferase CsaB